MTRSIGEFTVQRRGFRNLGYHGLLSLWLMSGLWTHAIFAVDLIPAGIDSKMAAGAGQTTSQGGTALFHNPANIARSHPTELDLDFGLAKVHYGYQHTDHEKFKPVNIDVTAPPTTISGTFKPAETVTLGLGIYPTGTGNPQVVIDIPLHLGNGIYQLADVVTRDSSLKVAIGAAYRPTKRVLVGLSITHFREKNEIKIFKAADQYPFLILRNRGDFNQFALGVRTDFALRGFLLGATYKPAVLKNYSSEYLFDIVGDDQAAGIFNYHKSSSRGYIPPTMALGMSYSYGPLRGIGEMIIEQWSKGKATFSRALPIATKNADLKDATHFVIGGEYELEKLQLISLAYGQYKANLGDGTLASTAPATNLADLATNLINIQDNGGDAQLSGTEGMTFGNLDAIGRQVVSIGYKRTWSGNGYGGVCLYSLKGHRTVPKGYTQEGDFSLSAILLGFGGGYKF